MTAIQARGAGVNGYYDIERDGAATSGSATAAMTAALVNAEGVYIPPGDWTVGVGVLGTGGAGQRIVGAGRDLSILRFAGNDDVLTIQHDNVSLEHFTITRTPVSTTLNGQQDVNGGTAAITIAVNSTTGFSSTGTFTLPVGTNGPGNADIGKTEVTYTGKTTSPATFTGCTITSGGTLGGTTYKNNTPVVQHPTAGAAIALEGGIAGVKIDSVDISNTYDGIVSRDASRWSFTKIAITNHRHVGIWQDSPSTLSSSPPVTSSVHGDLGDNFCGIDTKIISPYADMGYYHTGGGGLRAVSLKVNSCQEGFVSGLSHGETTNLYLVGCGFEGQAGCGIAVGRGSRILANISLVATKVLSNHTSPCCLEISPFATDVTVGDGVILHGGGTATTIGIDIKAGHTGVDYDLTGSNPQTVALTEAAVGRVTFENVSSCVRVGDLTQLLNLDVSNWVLSTAITNLFTSTAATDSPGNAIEGRRNIADSVRFVFLDATPNTAWTIGLANSSVNWFTLTVRASSSVAAAPTGWSQRGAAVVSAAGVVTVVREDGTAFGTPTSVGTAGTPVTPTFDVGTANVIVFKFNAGSGSNKVHGNARVTFDSSSQITSWGRAGTSGTVRSS